MITHTQPVFFLQVMKTFNTQAAIIKFSYILYFVQRELYTRTLALGVCVCLTFNSGATALARNYLVFRHLITFINLIELNSNSCPHPAGNVITKKREQMKNLLPGELTIILSYPEQLMQPSSIVQTGPSIISSALCSMTAGITGSRFLPDWFSTVNFTACDAACVRR